MKISTPAKSRPTKRAKLNAKPKNTTLSVRGRTQRSIPRDIVYVGNGLPNRLGTTLRYYSGFNVVVGTTPVHVQFGANDILVPNLSFTSQSAQYFDQLIALYNSWLVSSSKIQVRVTHKSGGLQRVVVWQQDKFVATPSFAGLMCQPSSASGTIFATQNEPLTLFKTYTAWQKHGTDLFANETVHGTAIASPPEIDLYQVSLISDVADSNVFVEVFIDYNTVLFDVKDVDISL